MRAQLVRWGNSHAVRIPKKLVESARLREGDEMELKVSGAGGIELTPVKKQFTLQELVGGITRCNRHHATDWGRPVGEEVW